MESDTMNPVLPVELEIWNAMTGAERMALVKRVGALPVRKEPSRSMWTADRRLLASLRACHAFIRANLSEFMR